MGGLELNIDWKCNKWAIFYCLVATIGAMCYGYDTIYYTGVQGMKAFVHDYGQLQPDGTHKLTTSFLSVSASIIYVGEFLGALITAPINDRWGRKSCFSPPRLASSWELLYKCALMACILYSVSVVSSSVLELGPSRDIGPNLKANLLTASRQFTATCLMYIAEVAPTDIRGPALMMFQFTQSVTQFIGAAINQGTETINGPASYRLSMALLMLLPLAMLLLIKFIPESPVWYMFKGRKAEAEAALYKIHKGQSDYSPEEDLAIISAQVDMERDMAEQSSWISLIIDPIEGRKLIYACGAIVAQQINGIQFWYTYGVIFAESIGVAQPFTSNTIIYIVQIITVALSVIFGNKIRRRTNLLVCTIGMLISLVAVGGLGTTNPGGPFSRGVGIGIVVFAYFNIVFFNFSIGTLSYTIASEMAVGRNRNKITAAAIGTFFFTVWLMVFTSPFLYYTANLGPMLGFVYGGTTLLGTLTYVWFCVGETTGRTNTEIEKLFVDLVPARQWRTYVIAPERVGRLSSVAEKDVKMAHSQVERIA